MGGPRVRDFAFSGGRAAAKCGMIKHLLPLAVCLLFVTSRARAGDDIPVSALPKAVTSAMQTYFPSAKIISAEADEKNDRIRYKLKAVYRELILEAEVFSNGQVSKVKSVN